MTTQKQTAPLPQGLILNTYLEEVETVDQVGFLQLIGKIQNRVYWVTYPNNTPKHCHLGTLSLDLETAVTEATERLDNWLIGESIEDLRWGRRSLGAS